jgi:zinc-binding alcohol dehydrogenase/oxidoreductase
VQAIALQEYGGPEVLRVVAYPDPRPGPGEVVVELRAAALNRRDRLVRSGFFPFRLPLVPGSDGAGIRRDTGEEVVILPSLHWDDGSEAGERAARESAPGPRFEILGGPRDGTYAELVKVPAENVFPKPRRLSWEEAAALPLAGLTAYRALFTRGQVRAGELVLVLGAGSGVSSFAVSLACHAGARVLVTSSSREKIERAKALGAEGGVLYTEGDWAAEIRSLAGGAGVDVVLDSVGTTWADSIRCLRPGGRLVAFGATGGGPAQVEPRALYGGQISLLGTTMGSPREFAALLEVVERGGLTPVVDSVRPLGEASAAHERLERGAHFGKLVLQVS